MPKGREERKIKKKSILFVVIAVILGLGLIAIPSLAIADDQGVEVVSAPIDEVSPQIPTDQFDVTAVRVALNNPNYPDFLGGTGNPIGVVFPRSALTGGNTVEYTILLENMTLSGTGTLYFIGLRGSTVVINLSYTTTFSPGYVVAVSWAARTLPSSPGDLILYGILVLGSNVDLNFGFFKIL